MARPAKGGGKGGQRNKGGQDGTTTDSRMGGVVEGTPPSLPPRRLPPRAGLAVADVAAVDFSPFAGHVASPYSESGVSTLGSSSSPAVDRETYLEDNDSDMSAVRDSSARVEVLLGQMSQQESGTDLDPSLLILGMDKDIRKDQTISLWAERAVPQG